MVTPSESVTELLVDISACVAEEVRVNRENSEFLHILNHFEQFNGNFLDVFGELCAMFELTLERIEIESTDKFFFGFCCFDASNKCFGYSNSLAGAATYIHLHFLHIHTGEEGCEIDILVRDYEVDGCDAFAQDVEGFGVGFCYIINNNFLANCPVVVGACTTHIGELSGERIGGFKIFDVFSTIHRLYIKNFICSPNQLFVEIGTLKVCFDFSAPLFG